MNTLTQEEFQQLMEVRHPECLSIYLPLPQAGQDPRHTATLLKNLMRRAAESLQKKDLRQAEIDRILQPLDALLQPSWYSRPHSEGMALFLHDGQIKMVQLPVAVVESVTVANRFRVRPLLSFLNQNGSYYLLALNLNSVHLYTADRYQLNEIMVEDMPASLQTIVASYDMEGNLQRHSSSSKGSTSNNSSVIHGYTSAKDSEKTRMEEFFRQVDAAIIRKLPADDKPILLACVDYLFPLYQSVSKSTRLIDGHVSGSPDTLGVERLLSEGWQMVGPRFDAGKSKSWQKYLDKMGSDQVLTNIRQVMTAAAHGRVDILFLVPDRHIPGQYDKETGLINPIIGSISPDHEDLLDLATIQVLGHHGKVFFLDPADLPEKADCLAVLRYA